MEELVKRDRTYELGSVVLAEGVRHLAATPELDHSRKITLETVRLKEQAV